MAKKKARTNANKRKKSTTGASTRVKTKKRAVAGKTTKVKMRTKAKIGANPIQPKLPRLIPMAVTATPQALPEIEIETTNGGRLRLSNLKGKNVVLYFYPKDDTPGCTNEGCEIRDRFPEFQRRDTVVLGVSRDSLGSHEKFKSKFGFPFELVADPDEKLCRTFGVIKKKSLYGKEYMGIDRSTFIFDKAGRLRKEFRGVQVAGHADEILNELNKL